MPSDPIIPPLLVTGRIAAKTLAVSERWLWGMTAPRGPIPAVYCGRSVRYSVDDLRAWIESQRTSGLRIAESA